MSLLFTIPKYEKKAKIITRELNFKPGRAQVGRFLGGDFYIKLQTAVKNKKCYLFGGTIDDEFIQTLLLAHTLRKECAKEIIAIIPYLGYARQDKNEKGKSLGALFEGELLKAAGIKKVYVVDLHSEADKKLFPIPLISIDPYKILSEKIPQSFKQAVIVAPDHGAIDNAEELKKILRNRTAIAYIEKKRVGENVISKKLVGKVGPSPRRSGLRPRKGGQKAIIVDDILDTGQTIIHAAKELKKKGVREIIVVITHALFSGKNWKKIWKLGVKKIYCADSAGRRVKDKRISYTDIDHILIDKFK